MSFDIRVWWVALSVVGSINCVVWWLATRSLANKRESFGETYFARRLQLQLAAVYAVVCAFRSFLPRADVQRICLVDTWWSSVFVGRSVATVAELCFAMQWGLYIQQCGAAVGDNSVRAIGRMLFPMIIFAEIASWYAVVSTNFFGNVLEQSTWTTGGVLIAVCYAKLYPQADIKLRQFLRRTSPILLAFIYFMCTVDIPHYYAHWSEDQAAGKVYRGLWDGLVDSATRWIVTYDWSQWTDEVAWMSLYFSVGVWLSIAFSHAPHGPARAAVARSTRATELTAE